jgi:hypothetical protein
MCSEFWKLCCTLKRDEEEFVHAAPLSFKLFFNNTAKADKMKVYARRREFPLPEEQVGSLYNGGRVEGLVLG